jgi:hypothetical protein
MTTQTVTFQAPVTYAVGYSPTYVAIGDLNGDGIPDLAVANYSGIISVLLGNGDGTFQAATFPSGNQNSTCVAISDLNGDGKPDLVVANSSGYNFSVFLGNGDGTFKAPTNYADANWSGSNFVAIGDLNGDGKPDLVVANSDGYDNISVLLGNGDGTFQTRINYAVGSVPYSVALGDLNSDGKLDVVVTNIYSGTVSVLLGNGDGTFQAPTAYAVGSSPAFVAIGDLNGDGIPDLAVTNFSSISVLLGNGNGTFQAPITYAAGTNPFHVAIGDLNGDSIPDIVVSNVNSNHVSVLLGNGDGTFQAPTAYVTGNAQSVAIGDLNGDGKLDLAVANNGPYTVSVLLNVTGDAMSQIETIYIGYFGRAGDPGGTNYWTNQLLTGGSTVQTMTGIAASYSVQPEAQAQYPFLANPSGATTSGAGNQLDQFINSVYQNLFGRAADGTDTSGGLSYWRGQILNVLATHDSTALANELGSFILQVAYGAQNTGAGQDQTVLANKVSVADAITQTFSAHNIQFGNDGSAADQFAHTDIASVTASAASVTAAEVAIIGIIPSLI